MEQGLIHLGNLCQTDCKGNLGTHKAIVELIFKILSNVKKTPMDEKVRKINKAGKAYQAKLLPFPSALHFLSLSGWNNTCDPENLVMKGFDISSLEASIEAIDAHVMSLGGAVQSNQPAFDPYKSSVGSTERGDTSMIKTAATTKQQVQGAGQVDKYDPDSINNEISRIRRERQKKLETKVADRNV
jgi:hypothetical protein